MESPDLELLERAYRRHGHDLWRAIYAFSGGSRDVADDTVAEAFAQAARGMRSIRDLRPWLYRAAFRIAAGSMANERARRNVPMDGFDRAAGVDVAYDVELEELVARLTPMQRAAFVLREILGCSTAETAALTGMSTIAVRVHVHGARSRLRELHEEVER